MAEDYRKVLGEVDGLRRGFTTGTAAAAASKAAAYCLTTGENVRSISVTLPKSSKPFSGREIDIPVKNCTPSENRAWASVLKDSGDDRDDTDGIEIRAEASFTEETGVFIGTAEGIGIVTGKGLPVKPGNPAINPVPESMIRAAVQQVIDESGLPAGVRGVRIVLSAPEGRSVAAKTWNSRIGVEGGISIIGTSGVVEPRSENAFRTSLGLVIRAAAEQRDSFTIISGYVGEKFLTGLGADERGRIAVGDLIGFAMKQCMRRGMKNLFLPLHTGKLTKVAAGLFNTHCEYGDARLETLAAAAGACGAGPAQITRLLELKLAEEAVPLLGEWQLERTFFFIAERAKHRCEHYLQKAAGETAIPAIETAALDLDGNILGWSGGYETAEDLCRKYM